MFFFLRKICLCEQCDCILTFLFSIFIILIYYEKKGEVYSKGEGVEYTLNLCKLSLTTQKFTYLFSFLLPPKRCHVIIKKGHNMEMHSCRYD